MKKQRCGWCVGDELYERYHDNEWGVAIYDDQLLFEYLILECMQAGLSWITILRKRENYRQALDHFDYQKIAHYTPNKQQELLENPGIIRNTLKVKAIVSNAQAFIKTQKEFGSFSDYIWNYVQHTPIKNQITDYTAAPSSTTLSENISKDLKKRGFKFVGPTIVYAFMQAIGMVNDHEISCYRYEQV